MSSTSTIPYDPSLVLGMIIKPQKIKELQAIAELQKPVDAARDKFNSMLREKLSLDLTKRELISLGASPEQIEQLQAGIDTIMNEVTSAATDLANKVVSAEQAISQAKSEQSQQQIGTELRSPIDFASSTLQSMPLAADTMDMDVQYFRYEDNEQSSRSTANSISTFVGAKVSSLLGNTYGAQAGASAHKASTSAYDNHGVFGTLVICANCTSKEVQMFSPMQLDPDAAMDTYVFYSGKSMPVDDLDEMRKMALVPIEKEDQKGAIPVISGASYGSSFIGFVHFEKVEATASSQSSQSKAAQARAEVEADLFLESISGSFGIDAQTASSVKNLLSTSNIQSHASVITMGLIPSIKSDQVKTAIMAMKNDPAENMKQLAAMQDSSDASVASLAAAGSAAKKGQAIEQMKSDYIAAAVSSVAKVDESTNQVIDLNSLMVALDDYVAKAGEGKIGVPINYYLSYITQRDIAIQWMKTYYPDQLHKKAASGNNSSSGD
ncbi:hypothetical protein [Ruegeria sp.]|uniref:hypothetical protein n=1 Tax=Ruegeria sp. TaxID=1879320 RepID=UPI002308FF8B|nr:hypothetical protein [Ruegeria sp.]MDA7966956.1 hypothetical protein [Ruegeria sp.]